MASDAHANDVMRLAACEIRVAHVCFTQMGVPTATPDGEPLSLAQRARLLANKMRPVADPELWRAFY